MGWYTVRSKIVGALLGSTSVLIAHNWFSKWRIISTFLYKTLSLYKALELQFLPLNRKRENQPINKPKNL
ncbi:hypothetical protein ACLHDF_28190 [Priestia aryabhattai]|uniref:hypothetical protein n=1 Tax=Priestia megaterium TaxID=1404 RepID=UPI0039B8CD57